MKLKWTFFNTSKAGTIQEGFTVQISKIPFGKLMESKKIKLH